MDVGVFWLDSELDNDPSAFFCAVEIPLKGLCGVHLELLASWAEMLPSIFACPLCEPLVHIEIRLSSGCLPCNSYPLEDVGCAMGIGMPGSRTSTV